MIKSTINPEEVQKEKPFPKLMIYKKIGYIILAEKMILTENGSRISGTVIYQTNQKNWPHVGYHGNDFSVDGFVDYNLPVILENE